MSLNDAISTVVLSRNSFYRDGYRLLLRISLIQGLVIVLLIALIVSMVLSMDTKHIYFATTADGRIINIVPLNERYVRAAMSLPGRRARRRKLCSLDTMISVKDTDSSRYFTESGWETFTKAMKDARVLEVVEQRKLTVAMTIDRAPEVKREMEQEGFLPGIYNSPLPSI